MFCSHCQEELPVRHYVLIGIYHDGEGELVYHGDDTGTKYWTKDLENYFCNGYCSLMWSESNGTRSAPEEERQEVDSGSSSLSRVSRSRTT